MRTPGIFTVAALAIVCCGQEPPRPAAATPPAKGGANLRKARMGALLQLAETAPSATHFDIAGVPKMESAFERQLRGLDPNDSFDLLGACSGVYLDGYGLVFTIPLSLIAPPPSFGPFTGGYTAQKAEAIHKRKLAHLPALRKALSDMLLEASRSFSGLPPNEKIAIAARLYYLDYEDKAGLPDQVVVSADRATALSGKIQTEEQ